MTGHIVIIGGLASGKTTLAKYLEEHHDYRRIVTYTTRPIRLGEIDGIDYRFVDKLMFNNLNRSDFFLETTKYTTAEGDWWYGTPRNAMNKTYKTVVVLNPQGALLIADSALIVWLDPPLKIRMLRALGRGDNPLEVARRVMADEVDFGSEALINTRGVRVVEVVDLQELAEYVDTEAMAVEGYRSYLEWKKGKAQ